jgi:hypothetical protein
MLEVVGLKWIVCWLWLWRICLWNSLLFHLSSFCLQWASSGLDVIWLWLQLWIVCSANQIPHLQCMSGKFVIDLQDGQPDWLGDCLTWRWANLLRMGEIWAGFLSILQFQLSAKLLPPAAETIFCSPIWILMETRLIVSMAHRLNGVEETNYRSQHL